MNKVREDLSHLLGALSWVSVVFGGAIVAGAATALLYIQAR